MSNEEAVVRPESAGAIHIAEDVVATIAALAAHEAEGVSALTTGSSVDLTELLGKKNVARGVKINMENGVAFVDVYLQVKFGYSIMTVAGQVQDNVKKAVESMTGLKAGPINVHVTGVTFTKSKPDKPEKSERAEK